MWRPGFCILFLILHLAIDVRGEGLIEVFGWKQMDYENRGGASATGIKDKLISVVTIYGMIMRYKFAINKLVFIKTHKEGNPRLSSSASRVVNCSPSFF